MCMVESTNEHKIRKNLVIDLDNVKRIQEIIQYLKAIKERGINNSFVVNRAIANYHKRFSEEKENFILNEVIQNATISN